MSIDLSQAVEQVRKASDTLDSAGSPFPVPVGNLAPLVAGTVTALSRRDWWVPGMRERCGAVLRDVRMERLEDAFQGAKPYRVAPPSASPALRALVATGLALGSEDGVAVVHLGIGSVSDGAFHEALNLAALTASKVVFVIACQSFDDGSPVGPQTAASPTDLANAYGINVTSVDGNDAAAVHAAVSAARDLAPHVVCADL